MPHGILTAQKLVNSVSALFQHRDCVQSCSKQLKNQQILFLVCCDWGFDANISASAIIILDSLWRIETQIQSCKQCSWLIYRSDAETRTNCNVQRLTNFCQGCSCHCENPCNLFAVVTFGFVVWPCRQAIGMAKQTLTNTTNDSIKKHCWCGGRWRATRQNEPYPPARL